MVKRADGAGHIRFSNRLVSFAELSGDPFDGITDEEFVEWLERVNERLAAEGHDHVAPDARIRGDSMREMCNAAFTPEEAAAAVMDSRWMKR